jgi:carboxylesterase
MTSPQDHVVDPAASDLLASQVSGPVERVTLPRSYHVATHDYDKQLVIDTVLDLVRRVDAS